MLSEENQISDVLRSIMGEGGDDANTTTGIKKFPMVIYITTVDV